jgi:hypothetical protein
MQMHSEYNSEYSKQRFFDASKSMEIETPQPMIVGLNRMIEEESKMHLSQKDSKQYSTSEYLKNQGITDQVVVKNFL